MAEILEFPTSTNSSLRLLTNGERISGIQHEDRKLKMGITPDGELALCHIDSTTPEYSLPIDDARAMLYAMLIITGWKGEVLSAP